jgi:hypothetical protein
LQLHFQQMDGTDGSDREDEDNKEVLVLPDISSLESFGRALDPAWRELQQEDVVQLLDHWANNYPTLDEIPTGVLLAAAHSLRQSHLPAPLLAAVTRCLASCSSLLAATQSGSVTEGDARHLLLPLMVAVFMSTSILVHHPLDGTKKAHVQPQQQHLHAMQDAALTALVRCCSLARSLYHNDGDPSYSQALAAVGQVRLVVDCFLMHKNRRN